MPLLCLRGGSGAVHDYLEALAAMAETGRCVIFYDQPGCSRSAIPEFHPEMWTVDLSIDEVEELRTSLGLHEEGSHMVHAEESARYMAVLDGVLTDVETARTA